MDGTTSSLEDQLLGGLPNSSTSEDCPFVRGECPPLWLARELPWNRYQSEQKRLRSYCLLLTMY